MPYDPKNPPKKVDKLPAKKQRQWVHVYNNCREDGGDEGKCHAQAWSVSQKASIASDMLKLAREVLGALPTSRTIENLRGSDTIEVMHGTNGNEIIKMFRGIDATAEHYRVYSGPRHSGIFVTTDYYTARKFGKIVLKFKAKAKNLHGTDYSGNTSTYGSEDFKSKYPNSFNPGLSYTLLDGSEPQALFKGKVSPKDIIAIEIGKKWYKLKDAREALGKLGYAVPGVLSIDSTDGSISIEQYFKLLLQDKDTLENSVKELEDTFRDAYGFGGEAKVKFYLSDDFVGSALDDMAKKMIKRYG